MRFELTESPDRDCSDIGKTSLGDEAECKEAASELEIGYGWDNSWETLPKGCFASASGNAYWNTHEIGSSNEIYFPICRKGGNHNR